MSYTPPPKPNNALFTPLTLGRDTVMTVADLDKIDYSMRDADLKGRVKGKGGALRPSVLEAQKLYVTYDYPTLVHVLSNGQGSLKNVGWILDVAKKQVARGAIVIPYIPLDAKPGDPIQQRLKPFYTDRDKQEAKEAEARGLNFKMIKYYSALQSKNEPFIPEILVNKAAQAKVKQELIDEAVAKSILPKEKAAALAAKVLAAGNYERLGNVIKDPTVPIIMIEGEYKGVALAQGMIEAHAANLETVMKSKDPENFDLKTLPPVSYYAVVATIGVNGVVRRVGGKKTGTYELLESFHAVMPEGRTVIVGLDNDCAKNIAVAYSAVSVAQAMAHRKSKVGLLIPPASEKKLGWDDYIVDAGITKGFQHLADCMRDQGSTLPIVDAKATWKELEAVLKEGGSVIDRVGRGNTQPVGINNVVQPTVVIPQTSVKANSVAALNTGNQEQLDFLTPAAQKPVSKPVDQKRKETSEQLPLF
jgi:hypothetical protein